LQKYKKKCRDFGGGFFLSKWMGNL